MSIELNFNASPREKDVRVMSLFFSNAPDFVREGKGIFKEMHKLLDSYPNEKIILTNADDKQFI